MTEKGKRMLKKILSDFFKIGNSYHYTLNRDKEAFAIGTMGLDDFEEYNEETVAEIAEYLIDNGVTVQRWIPVSERLPEYGQEVLVYTGNILKPVVMAFTFWRKDYDTWLRVTHWMPLPEPPKEVE